MKRSKLVIVVTCIFLVAMISTVLTFNSGAVNYSFFDKDDIDSSSYAYSMAIIGDTQSLVYSDVQNAGVADYEPRTEKIYDWLVANKESKKIGMVLGLGDITETWNEAAYPDDFKAEWELAVKQISKLDGNIPYTLVRGNHDTENGFDNYVGSMTEYTSQFSGESGAFMYDGSYATSYRKIEIGNTKWLILTLDWATTGAELDWAAEIIKSNPDHSVIVTMHSYLFHDMTLDGDGDTQDTAKHNPDWDDSIDPTSPDNDPDLVYNPDGVWERLISKHSNIKLVLSGHVTNSNVVYSQVVGDNGNTVTQMLINPQSMDLDVNNAGGCGMVCMLYFKEDGSLTNTSEWDGKTIDVEWYSTIKDQYYKDENQFELDLDLYNGGTKTEKYGIIPAKYANAEEYPFVTFGYDDDTGEYFFHSAHKNWTTAETAGAYLSLSRFSAKDVTAYILMRRDFNAADAGDTRYKNFGNLSVNLNIDLGGNTFTSSVYVFDANMKKPSTSTINVYGDEGSAFLVGGTVPLFWLGTNQSEADGAEFTYNFDGIRFGYADGATASNLLMATFSCSGSNAYSTTQNFTFNDCTFDLSNKPSKAIKLIQLDETVGSRYYVQKSNVSINGGEIISDNADDITLYSANENDSVVFENGESGALTLRLADGATAPDVVYYDMNGSALSFELTDDGESFDTYTLTKKTGKTIDVWLIGGQSNAAGYGSDTLSDSLTDTRYTNGFDNVLYYGIGDSNKLTDGFVPVKIGLGKNSSSVGAEVGIASIVGNADGMNAVIKLGIGSSYLYPDTSNNVSITYGTWTSPSYIINNGVVTDGTKIGTLYSEFINTVKEGIKLLVAEGYTPVIKGMWWMQGEAECNSQVLSSKYEELLSSFVCDIREDLTEATGVDCKNMPFVAGNIYRNKTTDADGNYIYSQPAYLDAINKAQSAVAASVAKVYTVSTAGLEQVDNWHFTADAQQYLGEQFVSAVIADEGKYSVTVNGVGVLLTGGGAHIAGENVTVTITAESGYVISKVTYIADGASFEIELSDLGAYTFTMPEANVVFEVDSYDPEAVVTEYGTIPSLYKDENAYPFAVFREGEFFKAYTKWNDLLADGYSILDSKLKTKEATVLLRTDYSTDSDSSNSQNLYLFEGKLTIDLGENTLTRGSRHLFQVMAKKQNTKNVPTEIIIKNGTLLAKNNALFAINTNSNTSTLADHFHLNFDGVTFGLASGYSTSNLVFVTFSGGEVATNVSAVFDDCTFDLKTVAPTSAVTLFNLNEGTGPKKLADVTVNGGQIIADSFENVALYLLGEEDSVKFGEGSGGYMKANLSSSAAAPSGYYLAISGKVLEYGEPIADGDNKVYQLKEGSSVLTDHGILPDTYSDKDTYPFVLFTNGSFVSAYKTYYEFLTYISSTNISDDSVLLLRKEYYSTDVDKKASNNDRNLVYLKHSLTVDLGGNTIERGASGQHLFQFYGLLTSDGEVNVTVMNGNVHVAKNYTAAIIFNNNATGGSETFNVTFTNVKFTSLESNAGQIIGVYTGGDSSKGNVVFNGCTFDLTTMTGTAFQLCDSATVNKVDVNVALNGCNIIMSSVSAPVLVTFNTEKVAGEGAPDSISFGEYNGQKTTLTLPSSVSADLTVITADGKIAGFVDPTLNGSNKVYTVSVFENTAEVTKYGAIPAIYPKDVYPFALFSGGKFVDAYCKWYDYLTAVSSSASSYISGSTLLLRRDYSTDECYQSSQNIYLIDDLAIDLDGNTFVRGANHIFQAYGKDTSTTPSVTTITVKNGVMLTKNAAIVIFNNASTVGARAQFSFTFDNVEFGFASGAGASSLLVENYTNGAYGSDGRVILNDCTVNLTNDDERGITAPAKAVILFNLKESSGNKNFTTVAVFGGSIIASSLENVTLYTLNDATEDGKDSFTFSKADGGNYTALVLPSGFTAPTTEYNGLVFVKISDDGTNVTYRLRPSEVASIDFVPKMSLTLDRDLVLNVYIPAKDFLAGFTLDGTEYTDFAGLKKVTVDGEDFYLISIPLSAKTAARDETLKASVAVGEKTATVTFTFGIIKYAEKIIADGSDIEKTLVCDVLSYVRAAYAYFNTDAAETIAKIDDILGENYDANNAPSGAGSTTAPSTGLSEVTFVLDATPVIRFYLTENADASAYKFYIDGVKVNTVTGSNDKGAYIDLNTYAYAVCETVTYTISDVESGSFHINAYYEWSKTQNDAELENLVSRFIKYSESARAYRVSVVEN